jgi:hypothetical protein
MVVFADNSHRVTTYLFLLDCGFLLFHSSPSKINLQEMNASLPCKDHFFEASSCEEFFDLIQLQSSSVEAPSLVNAMRYLNGSLTGDPVVHSFLYSSSSLILFVIINGKSPLSPSSVWWRISWKLLTHRKLLESTNHH